jgi:predicted Rossmann-fold nucleotide-binding protein
VACKGGTGTLVELAVVWEMLNKRVMTEKPFAVLGGFWQPILDHVRNGEANLEPGSGGIEDGLIRQCPDPAGAAEYLSRALLSRR